MIGAVRDRTTFQRFRTEGRRLRGSDVSVVWLPGEGAPSVAFAIGRSVGSAVVRNRVRRRLREALRTRVGGVPGGSFLVIAAPSAARRSFDELAQQLADLIGRVPEARS